MPKDVVVNLVYCPTCKIGLALGSTTKAKHTVSGKVHEGKSVKLTEIEKSNAGESGQDFLNRITKKYAK
jgi:hypothetical protein